MVRASGPCVEGTDWDEGPAVGELQVVFQWANLARYRAW